jgi:hypothetical protein
MNTSESGLPDVGHNMRTLRDGELDAVSGGADQTVTMLDYEGSPVVTYTVVNSWGRR